MKLRQSDAIHISEMTLNDIAWAFDLGERVFTADRWVNLYRTWEEYELLNNYLTDSNYCLVASIKKQAVGFILGTTIEKKGSRWKYGHMLWLAVEPDFGKHGIASKLVEHLTARFKKAGIDILMVDTELSNTNALKFFKKMGFSEQEEHIYLFKNIRQIK